MVTRASEEPAEVYVVSRTVNSVPKEITEGQGEANSAMVPSEILEATYGGHNDIHHTTAPESAPWSCSRRK